MIKVSELVRLGAVVSIAGVLTLVGLATAQARDIRVVKRSVPVATTSPAETVPEGPVVLEEVQVAPASRTQAGQAAAERIVGSNGCRKVKVIYAGYGEKERAGCPAD